ncbi:uncharacterized protein LOC103790409 [Callithrix jacchus]
MQGWDTRPADTPSHPRPLVNSGRSRAAGVRLAGSSLVPVTVWRSRRRGDTHGHVSALPQLNLGVFGLPAKTTSGAPGLGVVAARSRLTLAGSQESGAGGGSSTAPRVWVGAPETWRLRYWGGGGAPLRPPGSAARAAPPPHSLRVLFSAKKSRSCTLKALPSPPISARRAPGAPQSCCKSPGLQLQVRVAGPRGGREHGQGLGCRERPLPAPRVHASHGRAPCTPPSPLPPRLPPNQRPRTRRLRRADTPALRPAPLRPRPRRSGPAPPHSPSGARRPRAAPLRAGIPRLGCLRSPLRLRFPLRRARLRDGGRGGERGREGVCVREGARRVRVRVRGRVRAPLRAPLLPPVRHAEMPAESLPRASPPCAHIRAHTRTLGRALPGRRTPARHSRLALLGRSQRPPCWAGRNPRSPALRPYWTRRPQVSRCSRWGQRGWPRSQPEPRPWCLLGLPVLPPETRAPSSALPPFLPLPARPLRRLPAFSHLPSPVLRLPAALRLSRRRPLPRPLLPTALRCLSHSPHYSGCRPPLAGPRVRARSGRRGDPPRPAPPPPPLFAAPRLLAPAWR